MTRLRLVAAHEVVRFAFPRPEPTERERVAIATGRAIDTTVSDAGHQLRLGRRPTRTSLLRTAADVFDDALAEFAVAIPPAEREAALASVDGVVRAYLQSEIAGLPRPKSRVVLIGSDAGVYAQPDFWDGRRRIYEMKSYLAVPPPPDIALQLRLFQLAFPGFEAVLVCFDRHRTPVPTVVKTTASLAEAEAAATLGLALRAARELGVDKVREYVEGPFVAYPAPSPGS